MKIMPICIALLITSSAPAMMTKHGLRKLKPILMNRSLSTSNDDRTKIIKECDDIINGLNRLLTKTDSNADYIKALKEAAAGNSNPQTAECIQQFEKREQLKKDQELRKTHLQQLKRLKHCNEIMHHEKKLQSLENRIRSNNSHLQFGGMVIGSWVGLVFSLCVLPITHLHVQDIAEELSRHPTMSAIAASSILYTMVQYPFYKKSETANKHLISQKVATEKLIEMLKKDN